jgi:hypothetical protein
MLRQLDPNSKGDIAKMVLIGVYEESFSHKS